MFSEFKYESVPLDIIQLDLKNPRIVAQSKPTTQEQILSYLYEYEGLDDFVRKIASEGKNIGAERPYVVRDGDHFVVIEGNNRVAAYKVLTGKLKPPKEYSVPHISETTKLMLLTVDCSIAPDRDTMMPIMAGAHFGLGDKSRWGHLGSRQVVYNEWQAGKTIPKLAKIFHKPPAEIKELILEFLLYLKALSLNWSAKERDALLNPRVQFNPPIRFLQTKGHKESLGITLDSTNLKVAFTDAEAKKRFKHLLKKLVINPQPGLGATASYEDVFADYGAKSKAPAAAAGKGSSSKKGSKKNKNAGPLKSTALFAYLPSINSALIRQLMVEAKDINSTKFPACATFLLRNILESILKEIIHKQNANKDGKSLDLEGCLNLCASNHIKLPAADKGILKEFQKHHLNYVNLGAHGNVVPNGDRVRGARDAIDQQYCEPYAGGAGLAIRLLTGGFVERVRINDIDASIYSFWSVALRETDRFCQKIESTPVTIAEWHRQKSIWKKGNTRNPLELGFAAFFLNRTNRSGIIDGAGPIGGYAQTSEWKLDVRLVKDKQIENLRELSRYAEQIKVSRLDAMRFFKTITRDGDVFVYLDPPYFVKGHKLYKNFYDEEDHQKISREVRKHRKSKWVISYDDVPEIRRSYSGLKSVTYSLNYSAGRKGIGREIMFASPTIELPKIEFRS